MEASPNLSARVALVTGSAPRTGRTIACKLADAVVALCGPAWRYMTRQVIHINGGAYFGS
jgi:hypothetical protein